jgi:dsRNA-specific ribonuclease
MLSLAPVSYNQYQVLQQTCYHVLNLNEFLLIEEFIKKFFSSQSIKYCLLAPPKIVGDPRTLGPSPDYSTKLFMTQNQILERAGNKVVRVETTRQL